MAAFRIANSLNAMRAVRLRAPQVHRTFIASPRARAQGYGDGEGDPVGENPQKQPQSSEAKQKAEHPGPAPPDVGQGTGGITKAGESKSVKQAAEGVDGQSGGAQSKEAKETGSSPTGGDMPNAAGRKGGEGLKGPQGKGSPSPKLHNQAMTGDVVEGLSDEQKREVEQHNKDFDKRHDRAAPANDDKVDKKFWKGTGGRQGTEIDWNA